MSNKIFKILLILFFMLVSNAFAVTYYISPTGSDLANGLTDTTPWLSFDHSFTSSAFIGGDTLILLDGTYSVALGTGCINWEGTGSGVPPSGSISGRTIVRAQNNGLAIVDGTGDYLGYAVFLGRSTREDSYIKIQGIKALGGLNLYNAEHCYIKEVAARGALAMGSNDHSDSSDYNLIEDCWIWGTTRGTAVSYEGRYNIWRRVVIRKDGADSSPAIAITAYNSQYVLFQNVIVINSLNLTYGNISVIQCQQISMEHQQT